MRSLLTNAASIVAGERGLSASGHASSSTPSRRIRAAAGASSAPFALALLAFIVQMVISGNSLTQLGLHYATPGGNPLVKFHPATYLAAIAALAAISSRGSFAIGIADLFRRMPALMLFLIITAISATYTTATIGITGVGVYVDSYLAAGLLAVALMGATDRQRVILGRVIIGLCILNVGISVVESITQTHLIPLTGPDGLDVTDAGTTEFRGAALYTHPLTGALMTAMAIFLLLTMEMSFAIRAICFLILVIGLLSFGGRAALMVTIALLAARAALTAFQDLLQRRVNINLIWSLFLVAFLLLPILVALISDTSIGDRIMSRLYYDDSAEVRTQQWLIFSRMNMEQILFGVPVATSQRLAYQVGLTGVENPWILMFLSLGAIVLPVFLMGVGLFFLHLARTYPVSRWVLLAAFLITCTSNSVGTKSPDFFLMVACVAATGRLEKLRAAVSKTASRAQYSPQAADPRGLAPGVQVREPRQAALPRRLSSSVVHVAPR